MTKYVTILFLILSSICFAQADKKGTIKVKKVANDTIRTPTKGISQDSSFSSVIISRVPSRTVPAYVDPSFPGGHAAMLKFIADNIIISEKVSASKKQLFGAVGEIRNDVIVTFVVETDGSLSNIKLYAATRWQDCDEEALRVVKMMPKWLPAQEKGVAVATDWMVGVHFSIK